MTLLKTAYYNSGTGAHSDLATETRFLSYTLGAEMDRPATAVIILNDQDGTMMQKYGIASNQVYCGPGKVQIEDPDATAVFQGRILKAVHDQSKLRLLLYCEDWLSQLDEDRIDYDMREDLDGDGLRESTLSSDIDGICKPADYRLMAAVAYVAPSTYTDEIDEANDSTEDDMTLMPASPSIGDAYYFGFDYKVEELVINISQAGAGTWNILWQYWDGDSWETLTGISDGTSDFNNSGECTVSWTVPGDWATSTVDSKTYYWVRARVTTYSSMTTQPLGAQAWAEHVMFDDNMKNHYDEDQWNGYYVVLPAEHAGSQTVSIGAYTCTTDGGTESGDITDTWVKDYRSFDINRAGQLTYTCGFHLHINTGSLVNPSGSSIQAMRIKANIALYNATQDGEFMVRFWTSPSSSLYVNVGTIYNSSDDEEYREYSIEVPKSFLESVIGASAATPQDVHIRLTAPVTSGTGYIYVDYLRVEVDATVDNGYDGAMQVLDTVEKVYTSPTYDAVSACLAQVGGSYTNETTDANDSDVDDVLLCQYFAIGEPSLYVGIGSTAYDGIKINISNTYNVSGLHVTWQYSMGSGVWRNLSNVRDGTSNFTRSGTSIVSWNIPPDWATDTVNSVGPYYWVRSFVDYQSEGYWGTPGPVAAQLWFMDSGSSYTAMMAVDTDVSPSGLGLWEGCPYCICKPIYKHIDTGEGGTLITDGDPLVELTAATNIEHTTGISTRAYQERTRREILQDLAKMDSASFWIPIGGVDLKYKKTFNSGSPTAMTDASVLSWSGGEYDYTQMRNEWHVYGIIMDDTQVRIDSSYLDTDPGSDSKTKYDVARSDVAMNTGSMSQYEASALASALVETTEDVNLFLNATLKGLSTLRLGDEVSITSTYLGLTSQNYVITKWSFNSREWRTYISLTPRSSTGLLTQLAFGEHLRNISDSQAQITVDTYRPAFGVRRRDL